MRMNSDVTVAIGSLGTVGMELARRLAAADQGLRLAAVSARDAPRARARLAQLGLDVPVLALDELAAVADVVVECAPAEQFRLLAEPAVRSGKILVPISVAGLLEHMDLVDIARESGARIMVPSGAILGLDALRAAREGEIREVRMVTRKPPRGLAGAPHLERNAISVEGLREPLKVFEGSAAEGARGFPANVNVAAAVGLAGVGPERMVLEVWADPGVTRNVHDIRVDSDAASFTLHIENVPTEENPKTGRLVALSVMATLRRLSSPLCVGT
jgi:aspartate dehydrogenase